MNITFSNGGAAGSISSSGVWTFGPDKPYILLEAIVRLINLPLEDFGMYLTDPRESVRTLATEIYKQITDEANKNYLNALEVATDETRNRNIPQIVYRSMQIDNDDSLVPLDLALRVIKDHPLVLVQYLDYGYIHEVVLAEALIRRIRNESI